MVYQEGYKLKDYDVVIAGGGTSGVAAAIAAAKRGKSVIVIENQGFLGGMSTGGMVSQFMGFREGTSSSNISGVMAEILEGLWKREAATSLYTILMDHREDLAVSAIGYDSEVLKVVLDDLVKEARVDVLFHTRVIGVEYSDKVINCLLIHNLDGVQKIKGKVFIDATFHGSVAVEAGCEWVKGDLNGKLQPGTLMFRLAGVDLNRYMSLPYDEKIALGKFGIQEGALFKNVITCRPVNPDLSYCNMGRVQVDATVATEYAGAEMDGRLQVQKMVGFMKNNVPGFERAVLAGTGVYLGLRDSRRILGKHVLSAKEVLNSVKFNDYVAVSCYPVDIHDSEGLGSFFAKPRKGDYYVPYGCMIGPVKNLLITGRAISAEHEAHAAVRVMATCIQLGESSGVAASISLDNDVHVNTLDGTLITKELFI